MDSRAGEHLARVQARERRTMSEQQEASFVLGGPVDFHSPLYVERKGFEERVMREILNKNYVSIIGSRQVGKTSLLLRIQSEVEDQKDYASAVIDLSTINQPNVEFTNWASEFCDRLIQQLHPFLLDVPLPEPPGAPIGFRRYFQALADVIAKPRLLILIDEASAVPSAIGDPFYSIIRWIYTNRMEKRPVEPLQKYNFAFAGVFEPEKLVQDRNNSPFNVSHVIRVPDFTKAEVKNLVGCIGDARVRQNADEVTDAIYTWTEGHPFLSHCFCALLADQLKEDPLTQVTSSMVAALHGRLKDVAATNIDPVVKLSLDDVDEVSLIGQLLNGEAVPFSRGRAVIVRLELSGAIAEDAAGMCRIRNRIYEETFRQAVAKTPARPNVPEPPATLDLAKLRQVLETKFSSDELETLCSDLNIDYENIKGNSHKDKVRELVTYMQRRDNLDQLVLAVKRERPKAELGL
jgi:hypothetical protein